MKRRVLWILLVMGIFLVSCGGTANIKYIPTPGIPQVQPYTGQVFLFWSHLGTPEVLKDKKYIPIGRVSGRSLFCGSTAPINNEDLHKELLALAGKHGGNAVLMTCGYGGNNEAACYCTGEVIIIPK